MSDSGEAKFSDPDLVNRWSGIIDIFGEGLDSFTKVSLRQQGRYRSMRRRRKVRVGTGAGRVVRRVRSR